MRGIKVICKGGVYCIAFLALSRGGVKGTLGVADYRPKDFRPVDARPL